MNVAVIGKGEEKYICDSDGKHSYSDEEAVLTALKKWRKEQ